MNYEALVALISDLYAQLVMQRQENERLQAAVAHVATGYQPEPVQSEATE